MENKEPIYFHIKSGGPVKNMIKIMNQLQKANRPIIFTHDNVASVGSIFYMSKVNERIIR